MSVFHPEHNNSDSRSFRSIFHRKFHRSSNTKRRSASMLNCTNNNESDMSLPTTFNSNNLLDDIDCKYDGRNDTSCAINSCDKQNTGYSNRLKNSGRNGTIDSCRSVSMTNGENKVSSSAGHYGSSRSIFSAFRNKFHLPKDRHLNVNSEEIICDPATPTAQMSSSQQTGKDRRLRLFSRFRSRSSKERQQQPSASSRDKQLTKSPCYYVDGSTTNFADSSQAAFESNTVNSSAESANPTSNKRITSTLNDSPNKQSIDKQYESILNRYKLDNQKLTEFTFPSLYDSKLSKTSQSTVRIACLLNGYNPLNDCNGESIRIYDDYIARDRLPPRPQSRNREPSLASTRHTNVGVFNFEPFYNIAARRSSRIDRRLVKDEESFANITKSAIHAHDISNTSDNQSAVSSSNLDSFIVDDKFIGLSQLANIYHDTLTRAIYEQHQLIQSDQDDLNLRETSDMINDNISTDSVLDGQAFKVKVNTLANQLDHKCQEFDLILNDEEYSNSIPEDVQGNIQAAIGQSRLLLSKKINQFRQLCDDNIAGPASADDRLTTNEDLAGFWDMLEMQINQCRSAFTELDKLRQSNWTDVTSSKLNPEPVSTNAQCSINDKSSSVNKRKISSAYRASESTKKPPPSGRSAELRELIRQRRMQMKPNGHDNNVNDNTIVVNNATSSSDNCSDNVSCQSTSNYRQANNDIIMKEL